MFDEKVILVDGFAQGSEYRACQIMNWSNNYPPVISILDWSVADAGFGPAARPYYFKRRDGNLFYYSCRRQEADAST